MTIHRALHPRNDVGKLYVSRKEGFGLASIRDSVDALTQRLEDYIEAWRKTDYSPPKQYRQRED